MVEYRKQVDKNRKLKIDKPPIPPYVGECLLLIAQKLTLHPWFNGYSSQWKEEMIGDGLENAITYIDNFDPKKSKNPFAYFTQIIYFSFRRRIEKEKKQQYIKLKNLDNYTEYDDFFMQDKELYENNQLFIETFEKNLLTKKKKAAKVSRGVEKFSDDEPLRVAAVRVTIKRRRKS